MRAAIPLALVALLGCSPRPKLGGEAPHGAPIAAAGNWVPSEAAVQAALAGFPNTPFAGGSGGPVSTTTGSFSGTITSTVASGSQAMNIIGGAKMCLNAACTSYLRDDGFGTVSLTAAVNIQQVQDFIQTSGDVSNTGFQGTNGSGTGLSLVKNGLLRTVVSKLTVARTALTAAATTQDITLWTMPAKTRMWRLIADGTAAFDDAAGPISAVTITCGKTAGGAEYLVSGSLFTVNTLGDATAEVGASLNTYYGDLPSWSATTTLQCRFTSTGGNLSTLTTGSVTFYIEWTVYP
jgi:hypothetical protein